MSATSTTFTPPPLSASEPSHVSESSRVVRERHFPADTNLRALLAMLRRMRATGTIQIDIADGGVGSVRFREEKKF